MRLQIPGNLPLYRPAFDIRKRRILCLLWLVLPQMPKTRERVERGRQRRRVSGVLIPAEPSGAVFDADRRYRYLLWRRWDGTNNGWLFGVPPETTTCLFIMLNPSTADEKVLDPTVRRCVDFAKRWGCGSLLVANIFALRSTDPKMLYQTHSTGGEPIGGPDNDRHILEAASAASVRVAAWGRHGNLLERGRKVVELLVDLPLMCLGTNQDGTPWHPLYVPGDTELRPYAVRT